MNRPNGRPGPDFDSRGRKPGPGPGKGKGGPPPKRGNVRPKGISERRGPIGLRRIGGEVFELIHPRCVEETELDYVEGLELWKAGDPEEARDALRYALEACHDNLWVHVALGDLAMQESRDPRLARGHYGYAVELVQRSLPPDFKGRLPLDRDANRPFHNALAGLIACLRATGDSGEADDLQRLADRLA
jgi:tetratricopeptide (TPR) repeat protein